MKVSCQACGAKYTIADDKVRGRRVKVRCKSCRAPIVVDGSQPASEADAPAAEAAAPEAALDTWEVNLSDTEQRKMTLPEIREGWQSGLITPDAYVWKDGFDDWKPILEVPELAAAREGAKAGAEAAPEEAAPEAAPAGQTPTAPMPSPRSPAFPAPPGPKPQPPAARAPAAARGAAGGRSAGAPDMFSAQGPEDDKHGAGTGARNENSVLFSLDALKAGFTPAGQEPAPRRSAPKKSGLDDLMNIGGGSSLLGFDNQALLTAPAPEPPKPKPVADSSLMGTSTTTAVPDKKPNKLVLAIGGAVALLALVGIVLAFSGGKQEEVLAERTATEKQDKPPAKAEEPKPAEPAPPPAPEAKTEDAGAAAANSKPSDAKASDTKTADAKPSESKAAKPSATKPAEEKKPAAPAGGGGPFDTGAARAALGAAAANAASCKKPGGPTGSGKVVVTFAPSGRVTTANVQGGSFGGTPTGGCVASVFRRAKVPPFDGTGVTVSKSFTIN